jgi:tRNA nucleotidyltransferase/poly(A) polymerase
MKKFKEYLNLKENQNQEVPAVSKDWRKEFISLEKGFIPPTNMRPIIDAFNDSKDVVVMRDISGKHLTLPKKSLYLVGGPVRDFLNGKSIKDYDLATDASPEQIATILNAKGFKYAGDRTGKKGPPLKLPFEPKMAEPGSKKLWFVKGRDGSGKAFVISAVVNGEDFEIATFRQDSKVEAGGDQARDKRTPAVSFVDNPHGDASRRDFTINSMYIDLTKSDGPNNKLYDPTGKGWHDLKNKIVRTVGSANDRFEEDPLRILRGVRFHSRFSNSEKMDDDMEKAMSNFPDLDQKVALERIRDEFLKGLMHPETNVKSYINIYIKKGLMDKVFPGLTIHQDIPSQFTDKLDKPLALAWLLQGNPLPEVEKALSGSREMKDGTVKQTGWSTDEKRAVLFLLKLLEFHPNDVSAYANMRKVAGLTEKQIRSWVDMFNYNDAADRSRNRKGPHWVAAVKTFSNYNPSVKWNDIAHKYPDIAPHQIKDVIAGHEAREFLNKLPKKDD